MEKSESSDSDSSSSTSWVFVNDGIPCLENANTFHLDCSKEPIQELTEQDLLSAGSDFESDTDGVSVISESEAIQAELNEKTCEETSDLQNEDADVGCETLLGSVLAPNDCDKILVNESKKLLKNANILGFGVVLTAVFLGSCSFIVRKNSGDFILYDEAKVDSNFLCRDVSINNHLEEIVDLTIACANGDQDRNEVDHNEIKHCVKVQYETKKTMNNDFLGKYQQDNSLKDNAIEDTRETLMSKAKIFSSEPDGYKKAFLVVDKSIDEHSEDDSKEFSSAFDLKYNKTRRYAKNNKKLSNDKYKNKKEGKKQRDNKKHSEDKSRPKHEKSKNKQQIYTRNSKKFKNKYEDLKRNYEVKFKHTYIENKKNSTSKNMKDKDSGEWYSNWHQARQHLRNHNLVDERHHSKKRTKMQWYFKWMDGREKLRYKKSYRPYSSHLNV